MAQSTTMSIHIWRWSNVTDDVFVVDSVDISWKRIFRNKRALTIAWTSRQRKFDCFLCVFVCWCICRRARVWLDRPHKVTHKMTNLFRDNKWKEKFVFFVCFCFSLWLADFRQCGTKMGPTIDFFVLFMPIPHGEWMHNDAHYMAPLKQRRIANALFAERPLLQEC